MSASNYLENKILDHIFGGGDYARPATVYVALHTADPTETGATGEVTGGDYARVAVTNNATNFPAAASGAKANDTVIQFPDPTANWGTVSHFSIWDAASAGNCLMIGALSQSKAVNNGDPGPRFPVGELDLSCD